jgi:hypothetical protein
MPFIAKALGLVLALGFCSSSVASLYVVGPYLYRYATKYLKPEVRCLALELEYYAPNDAHFPSFGKGRGATRKKLKEIAEHYVPGGERCDTVVVADDKRWRFMLEYAHNFLEHKKGEKPVQVAGSQ